MASKTCSLCGEVLGIRKVQVRSDDEQATLVRFCPTHGVFHDIQSRLCKPIEFTGWCLKRSEDDEIKRTNIQLSPNVINTVPIVKRTVLFCLDCLFEEDSASYNMIRVQSTAYVNGTVRSGYTCKIVDVNNELEVLDAYTAYIVSEQQGPYYTLMEEYLYPYDELPSRTNPVTQECMTRIINNGNQQSKLTTELTSHRKGKKAILNISSVENYETYDIFMRDAHIEMERLQSICGYLDLKRSRDTYRNWYQYERLLDRNSLWINCLDFSLLKSYKTISCEGNFCTVFEHKYVYIACEKRSAGKCLIYPKTSVSSTQLDSLIRVFVGFIKKNTIQVVDQYIIDEDGEIVESNETPRNQGSEQHLSFDMDIQAGQNEENQKWKQVWVGKQRNIRIIRSLKTKVTKQFNAAVVIELLHTILINSCVQLCECRPSSYVIINSSPYKKYEPLTKKFKCIFVEPLVWDESSSDGDDDSERYSLVDESVMERDELSVKQVNTMKKALSLCQEKDPVCISSNNMLTDNIQDLIGSTILNLDDSQCLWKPVNYLYIGTCPRDKLEERKRDYACLLTKVHEFEIKGSSFDIFLDNIDLSMKIPDIICTGGVESYISSYI